MKRLLFTLLILCHIVAYSQNSSDFSSRAKQGLLTYEECMAVSYDSFHEIIPSLIHLKNIYSQSDYYVGDIYNNIMMYLYRYYVENGDLMSSIQILQELCAAIGHEKEAEKCFLTVINKSKNDFLSHEAYTQAVNNLSVLYMKQGRWSDGAKLLENLKSDNDENNYQYAQNRCMCYLYSDNISKAIESLQEMNAVSLASLKSLFSNLSQLDWESYWTQNSRERLFINNLVANQTHSSQAIGIAYDNALYSKNLLVNFNRIIDKFVAESSDENLKKKYVHNKYLREQLAYKSNKNSRDSLLREIMNTEKSILADINIFGDKLTQQVSSWQEVRESLNDDEIAIEYSYAPVMEKYPNMKPNYSAFVLRKDFEYPKLITLENVDSVEAIFYNEEQDRLAINEIYTHKSKTLHDMLWQKLTPYLKGIKTVYYSTAGPLSEVNFDVLQDGKGKMLNERYFMIRLSSTGNIANIKQAYQLPLTTSVLYGNITYDETPKDMTSINADRGKWSEIPSTKKEIYNIKNILSKNGIEVKLLEGKTANEESFKEMNGKSPDIIHLATHGFFIETQKQANNNKFFGMTTIYSPKESYMMWNGLLLAGCNNIWQGKNDLINVEDGILTADEISRMDLSKTKLVVLSACETGKGKVDPIDGVYGLQRAFKMAGAGTIVMSLWKVQDDTTSLIMTRFYSYLTDGIERHQALWKAMMDVKEKFPDPYYWAGFVMLD